MNQRGLENLTLALIAGDPEMGRLIHTEQNIEEYTLQVREKLFARKFVHNQRVLLFIFDMMCAGRNTTDIAKLFGCSRQYINRVYHYLMTLPELKELKINLRASKSDREC